MSKKNIGFGEWLRVTYAHGDLVLPLACIVAVMVAAFALAVMAPIVGLPLLCGLGLAFLLALRYAWRCDLKNPPWYMEVQKDAKTDNDQRSGTKNQE